MKTVVVGMSGGVDSSVTAYLLKEAGYKVLGLFMKNWEEEDHSCPATQDYEDALRVADLLQIPLYTISFAQEYRDEVFSHFLSELKAGRTPNPDILCNLKIKFYHFLKKAHQMGADFLATGHYCRLDEEKRLLKGLDPNKDQSYFLSAVPKKAFENVLFPVGELCKQEVRFIAKKLGLATAEKKDSTGICFIGKRNFKHFVSNYLGYEKGPFQRLDGTLVGTHDGAAFYTKGQRKGLGLGGEGEAWYVLGKDIEKNIVFVERGENHPSLFSKGLFTRDLNWFKKPSFPCKLKARVRYRQQEEPCTLYEEPGKINVVFDTPQRAVTEGQSVVFYQDTLCLGGGVIDSVYT